MSVGAEQTIAGLNCVPVAYQLSPTGGIPAALDALGPPGIFAGHRDRPHFTSPTYMVKQQALHA